MVFVSRHESGAEGIGELEAVDLGLVSARTPPPVVPPGAARRAQKGWPIQSEVRET